MERVKLAVYALSGFFAATAGVYRTAQVASGSPTAGNNFILLSVSAAVIGGTSLSGGKGSIIGSIIGVCVLEAHRGPVGVFRRFLLLGRAFPGRAADLHHRLRIDHRIDQAQKGGTPVRRALLSFCPEATGRSFSAIHAPFSSFSSSR